MSAQNIIKLLQRFGPGGPSSGIQYYTLCTKQTNASAHSGAQLQNGQTKVREVNSYWRTMDSIWMNDVTAYATVTYAITAYTTTEYTIV